MAKTSVTRRFSIGGNRDRADTLGVLSLTIAIFSMLVAGVSGYNTYRTRVDQMHRMVIEDLYETSEEWNAHTLDSPHLLQVREADPADEVGPIQRARIRASR
jgi:hypothetical protein